MGGKNPSRPASTGLGPRPSAQSAPPPVPPIDLESIIPEDLGGAPRAPRSGGGALPTIPPMLGIPGMVAAGMAVPSSTGSPQQLEEERLMGLIGSQQGALGGGPQSSMEMNQLIQQAMQPGNAAPKPEFYSAMQPAGASAGGGMIPAAMRASKPMGDDELRKIMGEVEGSLNARVPPPRNAGPAMWGDSRPIINQGGKSPDDVMTRIMLEEMSKGR
jgi:hypothetical protein